jgi:hypothetical protein
VVFFIDLCNFHKNQRGRSADTAQLFTVENPKADRGGNDICEGDASRATDASAQVLGWRDYLKPESDSATKRGYAFRCRQEFERSQLTELASTGFESWAKESFEIATKIAYLNGGSIGAPRNGE